ncbi:MAG: DEAD/DEAH box helicase, partial [Chitinophagaceae bacterium]|nr:DEAD/DEAH box helicase [Rubrivivax sp.]
MIEVRVGGAVLRLLPQRAAYLPEHGALLVADAHIGKAHSFRRLGVPVPSGTTAEALTRLDDLLAATGAGRMQQVAEEDDAASCMRPVGATRPR